MAESQGEVTLLLQRMRHGDHAAEEALVPLVYRELKRIAHNLMRGERNGNSLQTTGLVHEAYLRLTDLKQIDWRGSRHFFCTAAGVMRRILIDRARARLSVKRNGVMVPVDGEDGFEIASPLPDEQLLALDEALNRLAELDPRQAQVVQLRFFAGLSEEEIAAVLGISTRTVKRDWRLARAWLWGEMR